MKLRRQAGRYRGSLSSASCLCSRLIFLDSLHTLRRIQWHETNLKVSFSLSSMPQATTTITTIAASLTTHSWKIVELLPRWSSRGWPNMFFLSSLGQLGTIRFIPKSRSWTNEFLIDICWYTFQGRCLNIYIPTVPKSCPENLFCKMADSTTQNFKVKIHHKKPSLQEWRQKGVRRRRKFLLSDPSFIVRIPSGFCRWHTFLAFLARCGNHSIFLFGKSYPWEIFIFPLSFLWNRYKRFNWPKLFTWID